MVDSWHEIKIALDTYDLVVVSFCLAGYIVFVVLCSFVTKLSLNHKRERIWNLAFAREYLPHQAGSVDDN